MSGKIEIPRELAERLTIRHACGITDPATIRTINAQFYAAIDELRALLAMPVVERQPVAYQAMTPNGSWAYCSKAQHNLPDHLKSKAGNQTRALYADQPPLVAVVLPDRKPHGRGIAPMQNARNSSWNACLDKVKELNQ